MKKLETYKKTMSFNQVFFFLLALAHWVLPFCFSTSLLVMEDDDDCDDDCN